MNLRFFVYCLNLKGNVVSREELSLEVMEKPLTPFDRSLDMHISNLRRKLPERKTSHLGLKLYAEKDTL